MLTRRLDPVAFDMTFGGGFSDIAGDSEAVGQNVKTRLQLILGEWFLDTSDGLPYLGEICVKPANLPLAESLIKQRILDTEGVAEITAFSMTFNSENRRLTVTASVRTIYGDVTPIKVNLA